MKPPPTSGARLLGAPEMMPPAQLEARDAEGNARKFVVPQVAVIVLSDSVKQEIAALVQSSIYSVLYQAVAPHIKFEEKNEGTKGEGTEKQ